MISNLADFSVFEHFLTAGMVETLKNFRAVHLISHIGQTSNTNARNPAWLKSLTFLPIGITLATKFDYERRGNGELHPHGVPVFPSLEE